MTKLSAKKNKIVNTQLSVLHIKHPNGVNIMYSRAIIYESHNFKRKLNSMMKRLTTLLKLPFKPSAGGFWCYFFLILSLSLFLSLALFLTLLLSFNLGIFYLKLTL